MLQLTEALCHTLGCETGLGVMVPAFGQCLTHDLDALVVKPEAGDFRPPSVSQHTIFHALHTGVLPHLGTKWGLIIFHFCEENRQTQMSIGHIHNWLREVCLVRAWLGKMRDPVAE